MNKFDDRTQDLINLMTLYPNIKPRIKVALDPKLYQKARDFYINYKIPEYFDWTGKVIKLYKHKCGCHIVDMLNDDPEGSNSMFIESDNCEEPSTNNTNHFHISIVKIYD